MAERFYTILSIGFLALMMFNLLALGGCGASDSGTSAPVVGIPTNAAPVVATPNADQIAFKGWDFSYDASQSGSTFTDADGDALTYSVAVSETEIGINTSGAVIDGIPTITGTVSITITATDGNGGSASDSFEIAISAQQTEIASIFGTSIDLNNLQNYAAQPIPDYISAPLIAGNPITDEGATLGRVLFYDKALSNDGTISCASCHSQTTAFSDTEIVSNGVGGGITRRHSMRLINLLVRDGDETTMFWDERAATPTEQETQPIRDENEHGFSGANGQPAFSDLITKLEGIAYYEELFRFVYNDPAITEERIADALSEFTTSILSFDSKYDEGRAQVNNNGDDFPNFSADENAGKAVFRGPAGCDRCHDDPEFAIDNNINSHNGVVGEANDPLAFDFTNSRSPSLRDLVGPDGQLNGPAMHDGSKATLRAIIDHYNDIPVPANEPARTNFLDTLDGRLDDAGPNQNGLPEPLNLTETQKLQLEAFLRTLTGANVYNDPKWSDPFAQ